MKLWQRLDPVSARVLLRQEGAQAWLSAFPDALRIEVAHLTATVLDSEVADDEQYEDLQGGALQVFVSRFAELLADDPSLRTAVMAYWAEQGHTPALLSVLSPQDKPVLPS